MERKEKVEEGGKVESEKREREGSRQGVGMIELEHCVFTWHDSHGHIVLLQHWSDVIDQLLGGSMCPHRPHWTRMIG